MATTFAICAVFVPVAFMRGIVGKFFFPFGITVAVAVLVSAVRQLHPRPDAVEHLARPAVEPAAAAAGRSAT
jgi:multidrug efflux pump subunit AcrB